MRTIKLFFATTLLLITSAFSPASAQDGAHVPEARLPGGDNPAGETVFVPSLDALQPAKADPAWFVKTGVKKGIIDQAVTEEEKTAASDAAVLARGFFTQWPGILAEFREPSVLVEPESIAGINSTKPFLIIPSGGLYGLSGSEFFKAGLAEYVRAGGVVICFAQQSGADFTALPVPGGSKIEAAGWSQDFGPLFRASTVQSEHPLVSHFTKPAPDLETDGYLVSYPADTRVLLARPDGFPTLIVYPYGSGWVVVATLFSDFSYALDGRLGPGEKALLHDFLYWAKGPGQFSQAAPGEKLSFNLSLRAPGQDASAVKVFVFGPENTVEAEHDIKAEVRQAQESIVPFTFTVPSDAPSGVYHIEYAAIENAGRILTPSIETATGRFAVMQRVLPAVRPRARWPLTAFPAQPSVLASVERRGDRTKLILEVAPPPGLAGQDLFARAAGQEKHFRLSREKASVSFEIPAKDAGSRFTYALYHSSGRSLSRGSVALSAGKDLVLDRPCYAPGQKAFAKITGLGKGEFTLTGLGSIENQMISGSGTVTLAIPPDLPAGTYPARWELQSPDGGMKQGELLVNVSGYRVMFRDASLETKFERGLYTATAGFKIHSTQKLSGLLKLWLRGPDGKTVPAAESLVALSEGDLEVPVGFSFKPDLAGIWELIYSLSVTLPRAPGASSEPVTLASGSKLFDAGDAAILGIATDKPVYYEAAGAAAVSAYVYGRGKTRLELYLDDRKVAKERLDLSGTAAVASPLPALNAGTHRLRASVTGDKLESAREKTFTYGTRLPDLIAVVQPSDPAGPAMSVGVAVKNTGKSASAPTRVALYEGDPAKSGNVIAKADVPALSPGTQHVVIMEWPLSGKAGTRTLYAVADPDNVVVESNKGNNTASEQVRIPPVLLILAPQKTSFGADDSLQLKLRAANLSSSAYKALTLDLRLIDSSGKTVSSETVSIPKLDRGSETAVERTIGLASLPIGAYHVTARLSKDSELSSGSVGISIVPTLSLAGTLEGTPATAGLCRPFTIRYGVKSTGNITPTIGSVKAEIRDVRSGSPAFARQLALSGKPEEIKIGRIDVPQGRYVVSLKASAVNRQYGITKDFQLAEQPLTVAGPVDVKKTGVAFPRVLVWPGNLGTTVEQALSMNLIKQAFDGQGVYYKVVERPEDFRSQAMTGVFNTYLLFETDELPDSFDWLRDLVGRGQGLVIIGETDQARVTAETFGFTFGQPLPDQGTVISIPADSGLSLSGTLPLSGVLLPPRKKGARPLAVIAGSSQAAALIDTAGKGKIMVLPFSLIHAARDSGTSGVFSLFLRAAAIAAAPEKDEPGGMRSGELAVSSLAGPVKARIVETLPPGSKVIWTSEEGAVKGNMIRYELTAEDEQQRLLYVYQSADPGAKNTSSDVFYECDGKYVSQGKIE